MRSPRSIRVLCLGAALTVLWGLACESWTPPTLPTGNGNPPITGNPSGGNNQPPAEPNSLPASFGFTKPSSTMRVESTESVEIAWQAGDGDQASQVLVHAVAGDGRTIKLFEAAVAAGIQPGSARWTVSTAAAGEYRLRGTVMVGGQMAARTFANASVEVRPRPDDGPDLAIIRPNPTAGPAIKRGDIATIEWDDRNVADGSIDVMIKKDGKALPIVTDRPASGAGLDNTVSFDTTAYPSGEYSVDVRLKSGDGDVRASAIAPLQVGANRAPRLRWVFPSAPLTIHPGAEVALSFDAFDPDNAYTITIAAQAVGALTSVVLGVLNPLAASNFERIGLTVQTAQFDNGGTVFGDYFLTAHLTDGVNDPVVVPLTFPISIVERPGAPPPPPVNMPPTLVLDQPEISRTVGLGVTHVVTIQWRATDDNCPSPANCNSPALLTIYADPDSPFSMAGQPNGNELVLARNIDIRSGQSQLIFNTAILPLGQFTLYGLLSDGFVDGSGIPRPPTLAAAPGRLSVVSRASDPENQRPVVTVVSPLVTRGFRDGEILEVDFVIDDPDPRDRWNISLVLDKNRIANDDVVVPGDPVLSTAIPLSSAIYPEGLSGLVLAQGAAINEDVVPPILETNALGEPLPYNIRIDIDDGFVNPITGASDHKGSFYAPGGVFMLARLTAPETNIVDLRQVGRTIGGAQFVGFAELDAVGTSISSAPDFNQDGANEMMVLSQTRGAFMVFSNVLSGRYSGQISMNAVGGSLVPGVAFSNVGGQMSSVVATPFSASGRGGIAIGVLNVLGLEDRLDDDPVDLCDCLTGNNNADGVAIYDMPRYSPSTLLAGPANGDCPGSDLQGDGLPNSRSDAQDAQEFDVGAVCLRGADDDDLWGPINQGLRHEDPDPLYGERLMDFVFFVEENAFIDEETGLQSSSLILLDRVGQGMATIGAANPPGIRFRGAWYSSRNILYPTGQDATDPGFQYILESSDPVTGQLPNGFGTSLSTLGGALMVSSPNGDQGAGVVWIFGSSITLTDADDDDVRSLPVYARLPNLSRSGRGLQRLNINRVSGDAIVSGEEFGDHFGGAQTIGDINSDEVQDIVAGAPTATRDVGGATLTECGVSYLILGGRFGSGGRLGTPNVPLVRIVGSNAMDHLGEFQAGAGDFNGDGIEDWVIGAPEYSSDDRGLVGIVYGSPTIFTSSVTDPVQSFSVEDIGRPGLPGVRLVGARAGDSIGARVAGIGDFDRDGFDDVVINAPGIDWPAVNIEFLALPQDGDQVTFTVDGVARSYEFDTDNNISGHVRLDIAGLSSVVSAETRLREAIYLDVARNVLLSGRVRNTSTGRFATNVLATTGDSSDVVVAVSPPAASARLNASTAVGRTGVSFVLFGSSNLPSTLEVSVPDDLLRSVPGGPKIRSSILVGSSPVLPGGDTYTVGAVAGIGDFDGDGFADLALGAADANIPFADDPSFFRVDAGQVTVLYGEAPR